jgi:hypothetical protein
LWSRDICRVQEEQKMQKMGIVSERWLTASAIHNFRYCMASLHTDSFLRVPYIISNIICSLHTDSSNYHTYFQNCMPHNFPALGSKTCNNYGKKLELLNYKLLVGMKLASFTWCSKSSKRKTKKIWLTQVGRCQVDTKGVLTQISWIQNSTNKKHERSVTKFMFKIILIISLDYNCT